MARPLRIDFAGAWYHVMSRGHRGHTLFLDDTDRKRFLGAVAELPERFRVEVHAFVLMRPHCVFLRRLTLINGEPLENARQPEIRGRLRVSKAQKQGRKPHAQDAKVAKSAGRSGCNKRMNWGLA